MSASPDILTVEQLHVRRGRVVLLNNVNWRIRHGEAWAIIGANGSGKTSLLSALAGFVTPTSGNISVLGETYGETDWTKLRSKIGIVSSSLRQMIEEGESATEIVASGLYGQINFWGRLKPSDIRAAKSMLVRMGMDGLGERPWAVLSQGERQKVLIARALMMKPALLILDEPCAGLDPAARERFLAEVGHLACSPASPSIVLVTHHIEEILPMFTHVLALKDGEVFASGKKSDVLTSKILSGLFSGKARVLHRNGRSQLHIEN